MNRRATDIEFRADRRVRRAFWRSYLAFVVLSIGFFTAYFYVGGGQ